MESKIVHVFYQTSPKISIFSFEFDPSEDARGNVKRQQTRAFLKINSRYREGLLAMETNSNSTCFPIYRRELIRKGVEQLKAKNEKKAIYYLSKSCFCSFASNECASLTGTNVDIDDRVCSEVIQAADDSNVLMNLIRSKLNGMSISSERTEPKAKPDEDSESAVNGFYERCAKLPREWNIVQLTRLDVSYSGAGTVQETCCEEAPINLTLFRHSVNGAVDEPLTLTFGFFSVPAEKVIGASYLLYLKEFKNYKHFDSCSGASYERYQQELSARLAELIANLEKWLGPWVVLFSGKIKGQNGEKFEAGIYKEVDEIAASNRLTERQRVLLSLAARRVDLLNSDTIKEAAENISADKTQYLLMLRFLSRLRTKLVFENYSYYPCLIVLDQYLDNFPWEMLLPGQEMARLPSMYMLFDLFEQFKADVSDGYLRMAMAKGSVLNNPDKDEKLSEMSKRMADYHTTCHPTWQCITDRLPADEELAEIFTNSDLFVYSGHGSSLQYIYPSEMQKMKSRSVFFLFGCESVALKFENGNSEPFASHLDLFQTKCPAIVGAICIIVDNWTDLVTVLLLNQCVPVSVKWSPKYFGKHFMEISKSMLKKFNQIVEPSVLAAISNVRCEGKISLRMRSALVCRGLPVCNTECK